MMNYIRIHDKLLDKYGTWEKPEGVYTERHRKLPGCLGGKYVKGNAFYVPARVHLLCHLVLVKIHPENYKVTRAASYMSNVGRYKAKHYSWLKEKLAAFMSEFMSGENSPMWGKPGTMLGKKQTEEAKKAISDFMKSSGNPIHRPEVKEKMILAKRGKSTGPKSEETKRKISEANRGRVCSEDAKKKMAAAKLGKPLPASQAAKIANSNRGKKRTEEQKLKMKISANRPEVIAKITAKTVGQKRSEETKKKMSESVKANWITRKENQNEKLHT